jgi:hypothetical protein
VLQPARWDKLGLVIQPDASLWWSRTHAMLPTPEHVEGSYLADLSGGTQ